MRAALVIICVLATSCACPPIREVGGLSCRIKRLIDLLHFVEK